MNMSISSTNSPNLVTLTISPANSSPTRSAMNFTFFHSISSRSASSARRSDWLDSSAISCSVSSGIGPPRGARCSFSCVSRFLVGETGGSRFDHGERGLAVRDLSRADGNAVLFLLPRSAQDILQDAMHNQVGIAPYRRSEMRVNRCGQREVPLVDLGVARLLEGTQHQVGQDALFRLARNLLGQLLVHARRDVDLFGDLDDVRIASAAVMIAPVSTDLHTLHRQRAYPERVTEGGGDGLEIEDTLGIGLFVNAIERAHPLVLEIAGHALIRRQHELLDDAVGNIALGARDSLHQSVLVKFNDRLG